MVYLSSWHCIPIFRGGISLFLKLSSGRYPCLPGWYLYLPGGYPYLPGGIHIFLEGIHIFLGGILIFLGGILIFMELYHCLPEVVSLSSWRGIHMFLGGILIFLSGGVHIILALNSYLPGNIFLSFWSDINILLAWYPYLL